MKYYGDIVNTENGSSTKKRRSGLYMATIADLDIRDQENPLIDQMLPVRDMMIVIIVKAIIGVYAIKNLKKNYVE